MVSADKYSIPGRRATVGGAVASELMAAEADTDPRSTLLRGRPLAIGMLRRSTDALDLLPWLCLHRSTHTSLKEWHRRRDTPQQHVGWYALMMVMRALKIHDTDIGLVRSSCKSRQACPRGRGVFRCMVYLARNSALCRVMELLLRSNDALLGSDSKLAAPRPAMRRRSVPPVPQQEFHVAVAGRNFPQSSD